MRVLGLIPARGGSKRLPGKNIKDFLGKPLIAYTIEQAKGCKLIDEVWVSTENHEVTSIACEHGANVIDRPEKLALDAASSLSVIEHAIGALKGFDCVCLLQPTSPLREQIDIERCILECQKTKGFVFTANNGKANGAVYCWYLTENGLNSWRDSVIELPAGRSIDINTQEDFDEAKRLMLQRWNCSQ